MTKESLDSNRLAMIVKKDMSFVTMINDGQVFYYKDGIYLPDGDKVIGADIEKRMNGDKVSNHLIREVVGHIQRRTYADRDDFDADPNIINMDNGLYRHEFGISSHTSKYLSLHKSPIVYDPDATCPNIDKFIEDVVTSDRVQTIYEIVGYALSARKNLKRAFIFEGVTNSGKSVMNRLIVEMVGTKATTDMSPLEVSRTTFGAAEYYGKQLNLVDDLGNTPIENTGVLKSVIGGGRINAQSKYGQPFDFTPNILCVFATNEVPTTSTADDAFASRFSIIKFPNQFEGGSDNPNLLDKLTAPEELSGFFNKCMDAYHDLIERGTFAGDGTLADRIRDYMYNSNPTARFVDECCVTDDPEDYISKDILWSAYVNWAKHNNMVNIGEPKDMTIYLKSLACITKRVRGNDDTRYYAYSGVTLKTGF